ncbi:MAG: HEAT repeat domain-containing protein [bacterium]
MSNLLCIFLFLFSLLSQAFAQNIRTAEKLFEKGELSGAAAMLEEIYSKDKSKETKALFVKTLIELGTELIFKEQYPAAAIAFGRAKELQPSDKTILELFDTAQELSSLTPQNAEEEEPPPLSLPPTDILFNQKKLMRKMELLLNAFEKNAKKPDTQALKKMDDLLEASKKTNKTLEKSFSESEKTLKQTLLTYAALFTAAIFFMLILAWLIMRRAALKRQALLSKFLEEKKKMEVPLIGGAADKKFQGIDIIEAELSSDNRVETSMARGLLAPFLNDSDIETRIRAIKALFKYSKPDAEKVILTLAESENTAFRKAFCRLTAFVPPEKSITVLGKLLKDKDTEVKRSALKSLMNMQSMQIGKDAQEKITDLLKNEAPDGWVIS